MSAIRRRDLLPPQGTRIAVACCASRPSFAAVTKQLLRRLHEQGVAGRYHLHLIVVHAGSDLAESKLRLVDLVASFNIHTYSIVTDAANSYAERRNQALAVALDHHCRYLLFYDDDEHWVRPALPREKVPRWRPTDPLVPHLAGLAAGAVITCGVTLGQVSPIPAILPQRTDPRSLRDLGHVMRFGSEFLHRRSFVEDAGRCRLRPSCRLDAPLLSRRGIKRLTGGNLALDLHAVRAGQIPPYDNPPLARGEDALLGARVGHLPIRRVSACSFHDPFGRLRCSDAGEPVTMEPASGAREPLQRFAEALCGWIGYAPLLIRLGGGVRAGLCESQRLNAMRRVLEDVSDSLAADLDCPQLRGLPSLLESRIQGCPADLERMHQRANRWHRRWTTLG